MVVFLVGLSKALETGRWPHRIVLGSVRVNAVGEWTIGVVRG